MTGDELYAWQEQEPDGKWGVIAAIVPAIDSNPVPLVTRSEAVARSPFKEIARGHRDASGHSIRLGHFKLAEVVEHEW